MSRHVGKNAPPTKRAGKVDVDVQTLRTIVARGPCPDAKRVLNGAWTEASLHTDSCPWCHLVWCVTDDERDPLVATPLVCGECGGERDIENRCPNNFHLSSDDEIDRNAWLAERMKEIAANEHEALEGELSDLREKCALVMRERDEARALLDAIYRLTAGDNPCSCCGAQPCRWDVPDGGDRP